MKNWMDEAAKKAVEGYLRTCSSGGMPQDQMALVRRHVEAAADLNYFALALANAMKEQGQQIVPKGEEGEPAVKSVALEDDDMVLVPRALLGAACSAVDKKRDAPETLAQLRRYTTGDLSASAANGVMGTGETAAQVVSQRDALLAMTEELDEHPEGYDGPCLCKLCKSYA